MNEDVSSPLSEDTITQPPAPPLPKEMEASKKTEKAKEEAKHVPKENESKKKNLRQARRGRRNPWNEHGISSRRAQRVPNIITAIPLPRILPGLSAPLSGIDGDGA